MPTYTRTGTYRSTTGSLDKDQLILHARRGAFKSVKSQGRYWVFYWYDVATGQVYSTHVDSTMTNYRVWKHLCEGPVPYGVYEGLAESPRKSKNSDLPVISADGLPERWHKLTEEETQAVIELDIDQRSAPNNFNQLFGL